MRTVGFPISHKENENRRALVPGDILKLKSPSSLYFEKGYGVVLGYKDEEYEKFGCKICNREALLKCDIICDPKVGDADYLDALPMGTTVFGWIHAVQNRGITDKLIERNLTVYAWEKLYENGRHVFWRNNELAGEAAVIHAYQCYGKMPYETKVAVIGNGNTARGAIKILNMLGAEVYQFDRRMEKLLRDEIYRFDVIVNCVFWDVTRKDHIIYRDNLKSMKHDSMIIDVSCDRHGGIETSSPTTFGNPTYFVDGVLHYAVDHTPALFYKTFTKINSEIICKFIDELQRNRISDVLNGALIVKKGVIVDQDIIRFQGR